MKKEMSRGEAGEKIKAFFSLNDFKADEMRKIKRLAMKYRVSLKDYKNLFCKKCLSKMKGKVRVSKTHKTVECDVCGYKNRWKID